jgi:hypothetical protein
MFLAPYMLAGALAAGIPVAIHFFFRSRYRTVPWAAMKFLLESIEQTSRRLRFQELLLLILRCAVLVLLALAFARPLTTLARGSGRGDAVDAVFLFDTSYSMGARDGAVTRLDRAQQAALKVLEEMPPHSSVQVVTCADRADMIGPQSPGNLDQAVSLIKSLRVAHLTTDLYPGVAEAASLLERAQASNKEFYLFSDMQASGWDRQAGGVVSTLGEIHDKAVVTLVRCGTRPVANVAVIGIAPQSGVPRPGERVGFAVLVRNTGTEPVKDFNVALRVDNDAKLVETQAIALIAPGEMRAVPLTAKLAKAGLHTLTATVQHDDLDADNRFDQIVQVRDQVNVLVVDGGSSDRDPRRSSSYYLMNALAPVKDAERGKHYLQPRQRRGADRRQAANGIGVRFPRRARPLRPAGQGTVNLRRRPGAARGVQPRPGSEARAVAAADQGRRPARGERATADQSQQFRAAGAPQVQDRRVIQGLQPRRSVEGAGTRHRPFSPGS